MADSWGPSPLLSYASRPPRSRLRLAPQPMAHNGGKARPRPRAFLPAHSRLPAAASVCTNTKDTPREREKGSVLGIPSRPLLPAPPAGPASRVEARGPVQLPTVRRERPQLSRTGARSGQPSLWFRFTISPAAPRKGGRGVLRHTLTPFAAGSPKWGSRVNFTLVPWWKSEWFWFHTYTLITWWLKGESRVNEPS